MAVVVGGTYEIVGSALDGAHPRSASLAFGPVVVLGLYRLALTGFEVWWPRHRPGAALAGVMALTSGAAATYAALTGHLVVAVVGALVTVMVLTGLAPVLRRRAPADGLYLTPEGLERHAGRVGWQLPWREVAGAVATDRLEIVLEGRADVEQRRTTRWSRRPRPTATPGVVGLHPDTLGVDPVLLAAAISRGVVEPERRHELGTPASLEWGMLLRDP